MIQVLIYLLQVTLVSGIFYSYYHFFLRNKRFHQYNRFYLLAATIISMIIPFFRIPVYFNSSQTGSSIVLQTLTDISYSPAEEMTDDLSALAPQASSWFTWQHILLLVYCCIAAVLLLKMFLSIVKIIFIIRTNPVERTPEFNFVNTAEPGAPFSFFRWLFWDHKIDLRSAKGEHIFRHELFHIREKHSIDVIFIECTTVVCWVNPFFHLMRKEIKAIHEFLADQHASQGNNKWEYAELLLMQAFNTQQSLVNPFFHNQIKRRIAMITTSQRSSYQYLRKMLVLPVAAMVIALFAFNYKSAETGEPIRAEKTITLVVDAGHGGLDEGVKSSDARFNEAGIALAIAQKIEALAAAYNVNVVMTRADDKLPGNAVSITDGLRKRLQIANSAKADAFLSIHINSSGAGTTDKLSGMEAYVTNNRKDEKGKLLATSILQELSSIYTTKKEIAYRKDKGVWVLDKNNSPAVLMECGYINNPVDLAFITDNDNQEKIARKILEAFVKFTSGELTTSPSTNTSLNNTVKPGIDPQGMYKKMDAAKNATADISVLPEVVLVGYTSSSSAIPPVEATLPFTKGGSSEWIKFFERNVNAQVAITEGWKAGVHKLQVMFVKNEDGTISDIKPLNYPGSATAASCVAVMKKIKGILTPGNTKREYFIQPLTFQLIDDVTAAVISK